jgi:hypothetical protein
MERRLCKKYCSYYKSSKDSDLSCRGMSVVEKLMEGGKHITFQKYDRVCTNATEEVLVKHMCITCPFYKGDCDFIQYQGTSLPCGGFILLVQLFESGSITLEDIIKNIQ